MYTYTVISICNSNFVFITLFTHVVNFHQLLLFICNIYLLIVIISIYIFICYELSIA